MQLWDQNFTAFLFSYTEVVFLDKDAKKKQIGEQHIKLEYTLSVPVGIFFFHERIACGLGYYHARSNMFKSHL